MAENYGGVDAVHKITYQDNVQLALQQKESRLEKTMNFIPGLKGVAMQAVELVGASEARVDAPTDTPTPNINPGHKGIYVKPRRLDWGRTIPSTTEIRTAVNYDSIYVQEGTSAIRRGKDKILASGIFGPRLVVTDESMIGAPTVVPFDTAAQQIPVNYGTGGNTSLTVKKLVRAITILGKAEVDIDNEPIWCIITFEENEALYSELQVTSKDYRSKAQFDEKRVMSFMGINFEYYNGLGLNGAGYRRIPLFAKSGMHYGDAMPIRTMIERNPAMQYQPHPYMEHWAGATRSEDAKVVDILCTPLN